MIYTKIVFIPQLTENQSDFLNNYKNNVKKIKLSEINAQDINKEVCKAHNTYYKKSVAGNLLVIEYQTIKLLKTYIRNNEMYLVNFVDQIMIIVDEKDTNLHKLHHLLHIQNLKIDPTCFDFNKLLVFRVWENITGVLNKLNFTIESILSTKYELLRGMKTDTKLITEIAYLQHIHNEVEDLLNKKIVTSSDELDKIACTLLKHITYEIQNIINDKEIIDNLISMDINFTNKMNDDIIKNIEQHIIKL